MSNKFEGRNVERCEIETIGEVIKNRMFLPLIVLTAISVCQLLVMSIGEYWPTICLRLDGALFGLIGGIYTMAIGTSTLVISWLLVDDCSWFFKCSTLFCSSLLFIVCGIYYFYAYFENYDCGLEDFTEDVHLSNDSLFTSTVFPRDINDSLFTSTVFPRDINGSVLEHDNATYFDINEFLYICYDGVELDESSAWTPILIVICIFLGVLYFLFAVYLFISLDEG